MLDETGGHGGQERREELLYLHCTSRENAWLGYGKGLGEIAPPDKWQSLSSAVGAAPKWQSNPSWCLGTNCPSPISHLVKKPGQLSIAWLTQPNIPGERWWEQRACSICCSTCVSALVTCDGTDSHFSKMGALWAPEPPAASPCSIAGAGTNQTVLLMVPSSNPWGWAAGTCWGTRDPRGATDSSVAIHSSGWYEARVRNARFRFL